MSGLPAHYGDNADRAPSQRVLAMKQRQRESSEAAAWNDGGRGSLLDAFGRKERSGIKHAGSPLLPPPFQYDHHVDGGGPMPVPASAPPVSGGVQLPLIGRRGGGAVAVDARRGVSTLETRELEEALQEVRHGRQLLDANGSMTYGVHSPLMHQRSPRHNNDSGHATPPAQPAPSAPFPRRHHHDHQLSVVGGGAAHGIGSPTRAPRASPGFVAAPTTVSPHPARRAEPELQAPTPTVLMQPMFREQCYCCGQALRGRADVAMYETAHLLDTLMAPLLQQRPGASPTPIPSGIAAAGAGGHTKPPKPKPKRRDSGDRNLEDAQRWRW
jgi:hypothetical protein